MQAIAALEAGELLLRPGTELESLLADILEDSQAFCREKHGDHPEVRLLRVAATGESSSGTSESSDAAVLFSPFVNFSLHELVKNAMGVYERACKSVAPPERHDLYVLYINKATEFFGVTKTRPIYETAMQYLPDSRIASRPSASIATLGTRPRSATSSSNFCRVFDPLSRSTSGLLQISSSVAPDRSLHG